MNGNLVSDNAPCAASMSGEAFSSLYEAAREEYTAVRSKFSILEELRAALDRMPAVSGSTRFCAELRTEDSLVEELLRTDRGDRILYLPARAVFGRAVAVAEAQAWSALVRACTQSRVPEHYSRSADASATTAILSLMAEDAYMDMLRGSAPEGIKRSAAKRLVSLWDARPRELADHAAAALVAVWSSRRRSPPIFGTLLGSSELIGLSMSLDEDWFGFARERFADDEVALALAEFLFGLSHEEIRTAKAYIALNGPQDPQGLEELLGKSRDYPEAASADPRDLYCFYEARRAAARTRANTEAEGPRSTLEELYLRWTLERGLAS